MLTEGEGAVVLLPAASVAVTVPLTPRPSVERTSGLLGAGEATPDPPLSLTVNGIETLPLYQPAALAPVVGGAKVTVGAVWSIFTGGEETVAVLPARSVAVTVPLTAIPSAVRTIGLL